MYCRPQSLITSKHQVLKDEHDPFSLYPGSWTPGQLIWDIFPFPSWIGTPSSPMRFLHGWSSMGNDNENKLLNVSYWTKLWFTSSEILVVNLQMQMEKPRSIAKKFEAHIFCHGQPDHEMHHHSSALTFFLLTYCLSPCWQDSFIEHDTMTSRRWLLEF